MNTDLWKYEIKEQLAISSIKPEFIICHKNDFGKYAHIMKNRNLVRKLKNKLWYKINFSRYYARKYKFEKIKII